MDDINAIRDINDINNVNNIHEIVPNQIYLTGLVGAKNAVKSGDFDIIVTICNWKPFKDNIKDKNTKYVFYFAQDEDDENISKYFDEFYNLVMENPYSKILVHCYAGASRSASLVASYLIKHKFITKKLKIAKKYSVDKVIQKLKKIRPCVCPNDGFIKQLEFYYQQQIECKIIDKKI